MDKKRNPFLRPEDHEAPKASDVHEEISSQENNENTLEQEPVLENKEQEEKQQKEQGIKKEKESINALKKILHKMQIDYSEYLDVDMGFSCPRPYDREQKYEGKITIRSYKIADSIEAGKQNYSQWDASQLVDSKLRSLKPKLTKISKRWWESEKAFSERRENLALRIENLEKEQKDFTEKRQEIYQEAQTWRGGIDIPINEDVSDLLKNIFSEPDNYNKILGRDNMTLRKVINFFNNELVRRERKLNDVNK